MTMSPLLALAGAVVGGCVGSFSATVAVRAPQGEAALSGRSRCDACRARLGFAQTLPVVSWVARGGACAHCGARIDPMHLVGEILGAVAGCAIALVASSPAQIALLALLAMALLTTALIDAQTMKLPDGLTILIAAAGAGLAALRSLETLEVGLVAAATAFFLVEGVRRGFLHLRRKPGLGFGDVKLIAALALWLGALTPWAVAIGAGLGLIAFLNLRPADGRLPFGPWMALGAGIVGLAGEAGRWPNLV